MEAIDSHHCNLKFFLTFECSVFCQPLMGVLSELMGTIKIVLK